MRRTATRRAFTLVELMIVVAIIGVLAALAITGVRGYLAQAETAEARQALGAVSRGAQASFERDAASSQVLAAGAAGSVLIHKLCASAPAVPAAVPKGRKYKPNPASGKDFNTGDLATGWLCLKFTVNDPIRFRYSYRQGSGYVAAANASTPSARGFEAAAQADFAGNGQLTTLAITGDTDAANASLTVSTSIYESGT